MAWLIFLFNDLQDPNVSSSLGHRVKAAVNLSLPHTTSILLTRTKVYGYTVPPPTPSQFHILNHLKCCHNTCFQCWAQVIFKFKYSSKTTRREFEFGEGNEIKCGIFKELYSSVSEPPGRGPVPGPNLNYTGPREILLEFVILVF